MITARIEQPNALDYEYCVKENNQNDIEKLKKMIAEAFTDRRDFSVQFTVELGMDES